MNRLPRAVFDTNVWISRELQNGDSWRCVWAAQSRQVVLAHRAPMLAELAQKLRFRFKYPENHIHAVLYTYRQLSTERTISGELRVVLDDPDDDKFVECALVAGADFLVSSDHHLLQLGAYERIRILSPGDFLLHLNNPAGE